jgi:hypothetical protein
MKIQLDQYSFATRKILGESTNYIALITHGKELTGQ